MSLSVREIPMEWFADKLSGGEPLSSLLYGDGELAVLFGLRTGSLFTEYEELVTDQMVREMRDSLDAPGDDVVRGTDAELFDYFRPHFSRVYGGRRFEFADGVFWDTASREGTLGPVLKALHGRDVVLVANGRLRGVGDFLHPKLFVEVPPADAYSAVDSLQEKCLSHKRPAVYVVCCGLGAIPLIMRLRRDRPESSFLDMGSVLDVFVRGAASRGWRLELYGDRRKWEAVVNKHLDGVCPPECRRRRV
jgi:hypothetical protein